MAFHSAIVGDGYRLGAGSIVYTGAGLPDPARVGMRQFAVPGPDGSAVVTSDLDEASTSPPHALARARGKAAGRGLQPFRGRGRAEPRAVRHDVRHDDRWKQAILNVNFCLPDALIVRVTTETRVKPHAWGDGEDHAP
jgi:hypothetical protein